MTTIVRRRKLGLGSCNGIVGASATGIQWVRNDQHIPEDDVYIRWGCSANLPNNEATIVNSASAMHRVNDKRAFRLELEEQELCPMTWGSYVSFQQQPTPQYPVIVRRKHHAQGRNLHVCNSLSAVNECCDLYGTNNYYISELINKVAEYRVFVAQGRVVWVAEKTPGNPEDVAWNVAKGGRFDNVRWDNWPRAVIEVSLRAWELSKLHFGGVDVMVDNEGNATVLEINSAPSQTSPYRQQCVAKTFDWMVNNTQYQRAPFDAPTGHRWRDFIHPAIYTRGA
jgi:glutathione synthase/RimK-type ligase-like ATP-grasp enzyme